MRRRRFLFDDRQAFLRKVQELLQGGVKGEEISLYMPCHIPEVERLLGARPGRLRFFTLGGALAGFAGGLALTVYTALDWPIITGGKPIVSLPPFLIIAYLLTILFGSLASFCGFLLLARLPKGRGILAPEEFGARFVIEVEEGDRS